MSINPMGIPYGEYLKQTDSGIYYNEKQSIIDIINDQTKTKQDLANFMEENKNILKHLSEYQMLVVLGMFLGDEGKGTDAYKLALELLDDGGLVVSSIGGPNAGHKVVLPNGEIFVGHNLPGAAATGTETFLGQGKFLNVAGLEKEITDLSNLNYTSGKSNIVIAKNAHCIFSSFHGRLDGLIEESKSDSGKTGTTKSGMGPVNATEALRTGITVEELLTLTDEQLRVKTNILVSTFNTTGLDISKIKAEISNHRSVLKDLIKHKKIKLVNDDYAKEAYRKGRQMVLEGSQSINLGKHSIGQKGLARYPYVTSGDTSFTGNLNPLGLVPEEGRIGIVGVFKVIMSAVGNHPDFLAKIELIFPEFKEGIEQFARETGEKGETTGRARDLGFLDLTVLEEFIKTHHSHIASITLRKMDLLKKLINDHNKQLEKVFGPINGKKVPMIDGYDKNFKPNFTHVEPTTDAIMRKIISVMDNANGEKINFPVAGGFGAGADDTYVMDPRNFR